MKKTNTQKGITLIALIITIIVLLILAVVAIGAVTGTGIIQHAKNAKADYEQSVAEENATLDSYLATIENNIPGSSEGEEETEEAPGLYKTDGTFIPWDTLITAGTLTVTDGEVKSNDTTIEGKLVIAKGITSLANYAFYNHYDLTKVVIPNTVTSIGNSAFEETGVTEIIIPDSVTSLGDDVFDCANLYSIVIPDSVTTIGKEAFAYNYNLETVVISKNLTDIPDSCFLWCESLKSIEIPNKVVNMEKSAFVGCTSLTSIYIPESITTISAKNYGPFQYCSSTLKIYCGASEAQSGWGEYWNYYDSENELSVTYGVTREQYEANYK